MKLLGYLCFAGLYANHGPKRIKEHFKGLAEPPSVSVDDARYPKQLLKRLAANGDDVTHYTPQETPMSNMVKFMRFVTERGALSSIYQWYEKMDIDGVEKTILPWSFLSDFPYKDYVREIVDDMNMDLGCVYLYEVPEEDVSTAGAPFTHGVMVGWEFDGTGCWSNTGICQGCSSPSTYGGPSTWQMLQLGSGCAAQTSSRPTKHEFIHALGFLHEQQRPDASDHLNVDTSGLDAGWASQFTAMSEASWLEMTEYPYEAMSVMHYGSTLNGIVVMTYKDGSTFSSPSVMTTTDSLQIQYMYCRDNEGFEYKETADCPTEDPQGVTRPIFRDRVCDGVIDCANGEDEEQDAIAHCMNFGDDTTNGCCHVYTVNGATECTISEEGGNNGRDVYQCACSNGVDICYTLAHSGSRWYVYSGDTTSGSYYTYTESDAICPPNSVWPGFGNEWTIQCKWGGAVWGDGDQCIDHNCHADATCTDKYQDFECTCNEGYLGDGTD